MRSTLCTMMCCLVATATLHAQERVTAPVHELDLFMLSPEVVRSPKDGSLALAHSVLLTDEMGATDYRHTETLSDKVRAKKVFVLDSADVTEAELFVYGGGKNIEVNGKPLSGIERLASTGFNRARIPTTQLKQGENEVIFSGGGSLLIEPRLQPGRSFKSHDGGKTWSAQGLGSKDNLQGEYVARLRLGRYAGRGSATSQVVDLWQATPIARPGKIAELSLLASTRDQPENTSVSTFIRTGSTPQPAPKTWTEWLPLEKAHVPSEAAARHRWAQIRFDLASSKPQITPRIVGPVRVEARMHVDDTPGAAKLIVTRSDKDRPFLISGTPFVYQEPSPRLTLLRERYQLEKVIASGKTEMEQLMLLRHWVRNQWHTAWSGSAVSWMPPWDALMILESKDQSDCLTMCTHYAAVYTQCCLALGWNARHCILDHHCVSEVFVNQHAKWVMMDAGNSKQRPDGNLHFERDGIPLSALELHLAQRDKKTEGITVHFTPHKLMEQVALLCRPVPADQKGKEKPEPRPDVIPVADLPKYPVCGMANYRRYGFPNRNNYLASLLPGELYQGWSSYFYDGYSWVGDSPNDPKVSPEYSRHLSPSRPQDIDWPLNATQIHLARTAKDQEVQVDLATITPNLTRLEKLDGADWKATPASFIWKLQPGKNTLRVRSVNQFNRSGIEANVDVTWAK